MSISILMIVRSTLYTSPGGDTTQILMTAKYLRELDVKVDIKTTDEISSEINYSYDLIHFFNIIRPDDILPYISNINIPFVVSTIFVDYSEYEKKNRRGIPGLIFKTFSSGQIEYLKAIARRIINGDKIKSNYYLLNGHKNSMNRVVAKSSILLPNSNNEGLRLSQYLQKELNYEKVVNAIDPSVFHSDVIPNEQYKDHVLCVGRIEGRKNQLNLIKALLDTDLKLTIIGRPSPNHLKYFDECKKTASGHPNIQFIEHISHADLVGIYSSAKVHVLPSWFETTGLSSLEAGVMNCNIVVTKRGDTEEYFGDMAYYCEPDNLQSIREFVLKAHREPVNKNLRQHILNNLTWEKAASQTFEAYKKIIKKNNENSNNRN